MLHNHLTGNRDPALIALGGNLTRLTARALMYLVLVPSNSLSPHTPLRRAAIDLIGRGFVLWEPHLEVSKVLLGLLDMSSEAAMWVPSQKYGLPLTPVADCCRTARHTLATIALARPGVFITSVSILMFNVKTGLRGDTPMSILRCPGKLVQTCFHQPFADDHFVGR